MQTSLLTSQHWIKQEFYHRWDLDVHSVIDPKRLARWNLVEWSEYTEHIWWVPFVCLGVYVFMLLLQSQIHNCLGQMRPKWLIALWNSWLSLFSLVGACITITTLMRGPNGVFTAGWYPSVCGDASWGFGYTGVFVFLFIYSKLFELFDTYWMVIGQRNVICLHWYHHITVLLFCWHAYTVRTSIGLWFIAMNYLVHSVMYFYFFLSQVGGSLFNVFRRFKGLITILQISQMFVGMTVCGLGLYFYNDGCKANRMNALFGILMYTTYLVLFIKLFCDQQVSTKKKSSMQEPELFDVSKLHFKMKPEETPIRSWTFRDISWTKVIYLLIVHAGAAKGIQLLIQGKVHMNSILLSFAGYFIGGLGITAGAHRLYTHRSYKATLPLELFLAFCNCVSNQGSIWHWSRDHIVHHKYSESIADPHDARRGFFFSHIGWLLVNKQPEVALAGKQFKYPWLTRNKIVQFQKMFYTPLAISCCFILPTWIANTYWDDYSGGLWVAGFLKYVFTLHCTWCVNSLAHFYGYKPYDKEINPAESWLTALLSMGEGWHNFHHTYPRDYKTSEFGIFQQYNPTKLFIDLMAIVGLAYELQNEKVRYDTQNESSHVD